MAESQKLLGYTGGRVVLDDFLTVFRRDMVGDPALVEHYYLGQGQASVLRRALVAGLTLRPRDVFAKLQLMELSRSYRELEQAMPGGDSALQEGLHLALDNFKFAVRGPSDGPNANLLPNGVELSATQVSLGDFGQLLAEAVKAKFPGPSRFVELDDEPEEDLGPPPDPGE